MFDISKYLEKFKVLKNSKFFLRDLVVESIKKITDININPKNIDVKEGLVRISDKPIVKNEIFIKKFKILEEINSKTDKKIQDIV